MYCNLNTAIERLKLTKQELREANSQDRKMRASFKHEYLQRKAEDRKQSVKDVEKQLKREKNQREKGAASQHLRGRLYKPPMMSLKATTSDGATYEATDHLAGSCYSVVTSPTTTN